jgi:hypothetical protein
MAGETIGEEGAFNLHLFGEGPGPDTLPAQVSFPILVLKLDGIIPRGNDDKA